MTTCARPDRGWLIRLGAGAVLGLLCGASTARGQDPAARVSFFSAKATLRQGSSQVIAFRTAQSAASKRFFSFRANENSLRMLLPPTQLAGESIGYLRLIGLRPGPATLEVEGAKLPITVVENHEAMETGSLEIVTPVRGTAVWGKFAVGVEQFDLEIEGKTPALVLRLPNGEELLPRQPEEAMAAPARRLYFEVDAAKLSSGPNDLVAVMKNGGGREKVSTPLRVWRARAVPKSIAEGECRDRIDGPRPKHAGEGEIKLVDDPNYSGGKVVGSYGETPTWSLPVAIEKEGAYQMYVTARGDAGGGALPSIGVVLDDGDSPETTARLATTAWHRIAVGHPFPLTKGQHLLAVRFRNDFSRGDHNDRNLLLGHYELARVEAVPGPPLAVSFASPLDGRSVTGAVDLSAVCPVENEAPPPSLQLFVNGRAVAQEEGTRADFHISANAFHTGRNPIFLEALTAAGERVRSVTEYVVAPEAWQPAAQSDPKSIRFPVVGPGWNGEVSVRVDERKHEAHLATNGEAALTFPESLEGDYVIWIVARGEEFGGPPELQVALQQPSGATDLGRVPVKAGASEVRAGVAHFQKGEKRLTMTFDNDRYEKGRGDRNIRLRAVRLEEAGTSADAQPPVAKILYPAEGQLVGLADAVVAEVLDDRAIASVDLRIDGQLQQLDLPTERGFGPALLPLLTRGLAPGPHRLEAEARDSSGNVALSQAVNFRIASAGESVDGPYQRAVLLLNRFGYGPEPQELAEILTRGPRAWLQARLNERSDSAEEQNLAGRLAAAFPKDRDDNQVLRRAFKYLLDTGNPVRARFVMWAENHFSTWMNKIGPQAKAAEHRRFSALGPAPFFDLLLASITSPAMMIYLDQRNSVFGEINENYAREIMELHTLGVKGGYTQKDVTTLADLLTGCGIADEAGPDGHGDLDITFRYDALSSSEHFCQVLGMEFPGLTRDENFDRVRMALEMLVAHPSCAEFVSRPTRRALRGRARADDFGQRSRESLPRNRRRPARSVARDVGAPGFSSGQSARG